MTRILVASVGRNRASPLRRATEEYEDRLRRYIRFDTVVVGPARLPDARAAEAQEREGAALERRLPDDLELIALTREGERWTTRALADYLDDMRTYGRPGAAFAIGGAHGLAPRLLVRARARLALSAMTLPHEVARLVLTEQLYRAATILRGEPYHKGP
ncbi:MAG: 23S rRNA (pseudouridine(1915)-N(3))-methyltransferase RlmH [Gemmatimonadales bacterium]|nr:23S rRNA (pseudouridine(1915)-N(3))-methyltransferase RlmH [Candidatus Palauibacter denitrificans]